MSMKYLLVTIMVCLVILVGCVKESSPKKEGLAANNEPIVKNDEPTTQTAGNGDSDGGQSLGGKTTISKLLTSGKSLKCTFIDNIDSDNTLSETVYIAGKKFRIDVLMSAIEGYEFHMISDGIWVYTWNSMTDKGSKFNADELNGVKPKNAGQQGADLNKEMEFDCKSWVATSSMFELPSDIEFTDDTAELKDAVENFDVEKTTEQVCSMCANAPTEELREQCRENAQCP
jgi:hypothetical protein